MNYEEALDYIMSHRKFQKTSSHERMEKLLSLFENPHKKLRFVHIVGTNGKGSTSTALSYIFSKAGYKSGLFTSPYVISFGERIQINSEYIPEEEIASIISEIKEKTKCFEDDMRPTVFEVTTVLAMIYFERQKCDIVFLEAGIGGAHDSTNIIPSPLAAVFTAISLDHTEMLGDTVEKIAKEKSGIIKEGTTAVSYPVNNNGFSFAPQKEEVVRVIREECKNKNCNFILPDCSKLQILKDDIYGSAFVYEKISCETSMTGTFQVANLVTVIETVKVLREKGFEVTDEHIRNGISDFKIPGRTEKLNEKPLVILDGGHNEASISALAETIKKYIPGRELTLLLTFMKDKDYETCLEIIAPLSVNLVFTEIDKLRGERGNILLSKAKAYGKNAVFVEDASKAFEKALSITPRNGALIVSGSFYLVSYIRSLIESQ